LIPASIAAIRYKGCKAGCFQSCKHAKIAPPAANTLPQMIMAEEEHISHNSKEHDFVINLLPFPLSLAVAAIVCYCERATNYTQLTTAPRWIHMLRLTEPLAVVF